MPDRPPLQKRTPAGNLPPSVARALRRATLPGSRWSIDVPTLRILLDGLRRWDPDR